MGLTYADVRIRGPKGSEDAKVLVDTGSTFTWIAEQVLEKAGVESTSRRRFRTIEGREIERPVGEALLEFSGERATTLVVFAEKDDASVLGAYALEGLGFEVDPVSKQLKKVEAFITY